MAAAAVSLACPLRRSTRLAHHRKHPPHSEHDSELDSDPENELTPRALRALKRQRLALDTHALFITPRSRPRKRRKENTSPAHRPSHHPLPPKRSQPPSQGHVHLSTLSSSLHSCHIPHSTATSVPEPITDPPNDNRPSFLAELPSKPELSIPLPPISPVPSSFSSDSDSLTPLTPLTPSPESSPSLPGHDRLSLPPPSPPHEPLPPPAAIGPIPIPEPTHTDPFTPPPLSPSLDPVLDTLIPFDAIHPPFDPELSVQIPHPPTPPQLQSLDLQSQFHSFQQHQLYVPPNPVFVRDREINIWKLACQERVDCLLRRYGTDYIKALVESQARSVPRPSSSSGTTTQTKFRLYTPASYTYSLSTWGSTSGSRKTLPADDQADDADPGWPMDDADWVDADVDMEDEDEDDYEDEDDAAETEAEREGEGEATPEAVEGSAITANKPVTQPTSTMDVDDSSSDARQTTKASPTSEAPVQPRLPPETSIRPSTPIPPFPPPHALTPPNLPPLSSLHVPLLSEPPRAFMGRGTPPDPRRLIEWSGSGRFPTSGMGPPLYLSPVPQRHPSPDVGIIPISVDSPIPPQVASPHTHGEWTSFLYSMLEGDGVGVGVGVGTSVGGGGHSSESPWYELGLASVPPVVPEPSLDLPPTHTRTTTPVPAAEQSVEEGSNSSSTLRFALG